MDRIEGGQVMVDFNKVGGQTRVQSAQNTDGANRKPFVPEKLSIWDKAKAYYDGFVGYYADKYKGTTGIGDFFGRTWDIHSEGAEMIDNATFDKVKDPIKNWSNSIAERLDDGDDNHLSMGERLWSAAEGIGAIGDTFFSTKGIEASGLIVGGVGLAAAGTVGLASAVGGTGAAATTSATIGVTMNAAGTVVGTGLTVKGTYDIATAKTKDQARTGGTELGAGGMMLGASAVTAKDTLVAAREAGIRAANPENLSTIGAMIENVKIAPTAIAQSVGVYHPEAFTTLITANSAELAGQTRYMSKPNEVQAYKFNPNGTSEEVLANNPHVIQTADGKYAIPNKWNPNEPYIIDPSKNQMVMIYGEDDFAVCEGSIFKGSYVDTARFNADGSLIYQDPANLKFGKIVNVTKQAPGGFVEAPVGTEVKTLEGLRTVGEGEIIAVDHAGNPYVTTKANILKRNIPVDAASQRSFANLQKSIEVSQQAGFQVKSALCDEYNSLMSEMAADKGSLGLNAGREDMMRIMQGLDEMCKTNNLTPEAYARLAQTVHPDLPGCYWRNAIYIYSRYGVNAKPEQIMNMVRAYMKNIPTVNGGSSVFR